MTLGLQAEFASKVYAIAFSKRMIQGVHDSVSQNGRLTPETARLLDH
ncbi:MAG: hypothetical protein WCO86_09905 [Planctomycetota bacterium]